MLLTYDIISKGFVVIAAATCPLLLFVNAPFGRFTLPNDHALTIFNVDGIKSWIFMELFSPITFTYAFTQAPLLDHVSRVSAPQGLLAGLFLAHYLNRALVSPLRTPSRSRSHLSVVLAGMCFNIFNGLMMGTYLRSDIAHAFLSVAFRRPSYWGGILIWLAGFTGNILHDEILLNIRRNAKAKGKAKYEDDPAKKRAEHYAIPHGYLYKYISYPNYFCEWVEWIAFAFAAAPLPPLSSPAAFMENIHGPWVFVLSEILLMLPRAYKGHQWYLDKFAEYPKERKAVVPFII
ncbi:3-oxo-5-alpha-steroid 4-dehydrogenase-domain-containing protein [Pisolithus orientalis]|uniref:3-oxo-5-alpha-steroid 4-dehydrogenase-domain-containing protein n=1 Tax=Pisolithus orientalis TaxID=936130 RepID=UPI0022258843|nr:3-oxo-5-alpha-steroid 4-dehydrogenase-domain-containing protein [Pisolithus orientalis]KAI6007707.1 3-oxo-5-alpha-steroid 4-dehydrogenase-domain-containing protein [Pisolithus orientalis]